MRFVLVAPAKGARNFYPTSDPSTFLPAQYWSTMPCACLMPDDQRAASCASYLPLTTPMLLGSCTGEAEQIDMNVWLV